VRLLLARGRRFGGLCQSTSFGHEVCQELLVDGLVAELSHMAFAGQLLHFSELSFERLFGDVFSVGVLHPVHAEQVTETHLHLFSHDHGLFLGEYAARGAVRAPGRLAVVGGSHRVDVDVSGQYLVEHAAALAGLQLEHQLLVHVLLVHGLQCLDEDVGRQRLVWKRDDAHSAVVRKVHEHVVRCRALQDRLASWYFAGISR